MNFKNFIKLFTISLLLFNCSSSGDEPMSQPNNPDPDPDPNSSSITYNANVRAIINNNCTSCHGDPTTNSAPMSLITYTQVKGAVETRGLINRINDTDNPMPQNGLMSQANRDLIQQWVNDGLLEN